MTAFFGVLVMLGFHLLRPAPAALLWIAAAALLARRFRPTLFPTLTLPAGPRRLTAAGAVLCLLSLLLTWERSPARWVGGYEMAAGAAEPVWNPATLFLPAAARDGRALPLALLVESALVLLLLYARRTSAQPSRRTWALIAALAVWWAAHLAKAPGPAVFAAGLALVAAGFLGAERARSRA